MEQSVENYSTKNPQKKVIKLKTQDQIPDFMKDDGYFKGIVDGIVNGWIEGFIEGFTKEPMENLLEKLQSNILKTDINDSLESTKEKIIKQITKVIFEQYPQEIEALYNQANELAKDDKQSFEIIDTLFK